MGRVGSPCAFLFAAPMRKHPCAVELSIGKLSSPFRIQAPATQRLTLPRGKENAWSIVPGSCFRIRVCLSHLPVLLGDVAAPLGSSRHSLGRCERCRRCHYRRVSSNRIWPTYDLKTVEIEFIDGEIVFRRDGLRIVWGHAPGHEKEERSRRQRSSYNACSIIGELTTGWRAWNTMFAFWLIRDTFR